MSRWLKREIRVICFSVVRFIDTSVSTAMGCFFDCFRDRPNRASHHSKPLTPPSPPPDSVKSKNRLSSLFLSEENENEREEEKKQGQYDDRVDSSFGSLQSIKELRDEAKFLKACGTLAQTPVEIRKASGKFKDSELSDSKFHSWLPNASIERLELESDKQIDQTPSPMQRCQERRRILVSSEDPNPGSVGTVSITSNQDGEADETDKFTTTTASPCLSATNVQGRNKSVRFQCDFDTASSKGSSSENSSQVPKKFEFPGDLSASKHSPKPTPLKLSDEMQTPGTVFPANLEIVANGKTRIRSQYVYSLSDPVENTTQWKGLQEGNSSSVPVEMQEFVAQSENSTAKSKISEKETSSAKDMMVEESLSAWLKPPAHDGNNPNPGNTSLKSPRFGKTPGDRPIIGTVAAHWNENDLSNISPKWWDGNGIPNSTNKYKEDQKVSWHATPFEERLEKALSEESFISQRKPMNGGPIDFDDCNESDTAVSRLQSSMHSKSVVSF